VASILMQRAKNVGTDPFWVEAPRNLLASVMTSLRLGLPRDGEKPSEIQWDFRDLVLVMQSQETIRKVIVRHLDEAPARRFYKRTPAAPGYIIALWRPDGTLIASTNGLARPAS